MLDFYKGMDLSFVPQLEAEGMITRDFDGTPCDPLSLAKKYGVNSVRLRIWNEPQNVPESGGWCSLAHTVDMAKRIQAEGLDFLLDFHYSDYWADPGQQRKPKAWENLPFDELEVAVYDYTREVLLRLKSAGALPDMVQIGNEIRSGLLFPDGEAPDFAHMIRLVNAGIRAVRSVGGREMLVMIHLDQGGRYLYSKNWFDHAIANGLADFDVIGLSYYPFWHGTFADLKTTMEQLVRDYHKPLILAETAHAWRKSAHGFIDETQEKIAGVPATPEGQRKVLDLVMNITASLPDGMGRGIYYWEPFCVPQPEIGGWSENMGLLSENGTVMEGIRAFAFTPAQQRFTDTAKVYLPEQVTAAPGGVLVLPTTAQVLSYDGVLHPRAVTWQLPADLASLTAAPGQRMLVGQVEGVAAPVQLALCVCSEAAEGENLLADPNFDEGLVRWSMEADDCVSVQISPEFIDPFPAPPVNAVRLESGKNFRFALSQSITLQTPQHLRLSAEYRGTDTTNVDVRLFLRDAAGRVTEAVIHPTEHEWQRITVECDAPAGALSAGLRIVSPPVYGLLRRCALRAQAPVSKGENNHE